MKVLQFIVAMLFLSSAIACESNTNSKPANKDSTTLASQQGEDSLDAEDLKELAPVVGGLAK